MGVFNKYAGTDERKDTLSKAEVKTLVEKEFPHFLQLGDKKEVEAMLMELMSQGDQEVDFCQFMCQVATLTIIGKAIFEQLEACPQ
ncbi:unnamed protein product [Tetraodon nigroviridis]|nr:unnamed protein product [Tetraodon nigroviridis]